MRVLFASAAAVLLSGCWLFPLPAPCDGGTCADTDGGPWQDGSVIGCSGDGVDGGWSANTGDGGPHACDWSDAGLDAGPACNPVDGGCPPSAPPLCANALELDLPVPGGFLPEGSRPWCTPTPPTVGSVCYVPTATCNYGSRQPGCFNREYVCGTTSWAEGLHTDPNVPWNATDCQQGLTLPAGCPVATSAFFVHCGDACSLPAGTVCDYGRAAERCVQWQLRCDGGAWQRLPEDPWAYCGCTRTPGGPVDAG